MSCLRPFALTVPVLVAAAVSFSPPRAAFGGDGPSVPEHLRDRPSSLSVRAGDKIVEAPAALLRLARTYPQFADKGELKGGRRITLLAEQTRCRVGEPVRVLHVLEAVAPGLEVFVMGPKPVHGEFVDGKDARPARAPEHYDGRVLRGPAVDFHYDITSYRFDTPGRHTIQWKGGGHPIEGDLGLASNVLRIEVTE